MTIAPLPDEKARQRIRTRLDENFLVEAGAGTGKTRLLVDRIEALVATGTARLRNVVAITFTEKAAAELRVRIRERVEGRLREAAGESRNRFRTALEDLEIAPISTIHAFAADLLRERPVEAGVDPEFTVADELQASLFRTEAWDRWLEKQKDAAQEALRDAIEFGVALKQLRAVGDALLRYRDVLAAEVDRGSRPRDPVMWLSANEPELRAFVSRIASDCYDDDDNGAEDLRTLEQRLDLLGRLDEAEVRRSILGGLKLKIGGRQENWRAGVLRGMKDRLAGLHDELDALRAAHGHWLAAGAVNWLRGYVGEYQVLKAREGVLDFDDLLLLARNLLRDHSGVRRDFQERFQAVLVDEFQDTDPLQAEIIFFLAEDGSEATSWDQVRLRPGKLFIVGDPKQSIYAFRRADIETYELAKEVLRRSGQVEYITSNFRSVQELLEAVNGTFEGKMRRPQDGAYQPEYISLQPSTSTRSAGGSPALTLLYPDVGDDEDLDMTTLRRCEAEGLAAFLRQSIEQGTWRTREERRPAAFGDVALLFRGMSDVPIYEEAFKRYDIPYRVTSSRTFYKREEVGWLLNVLHATEHPTDPVAVWGAIRSPFFGCSDREIYDFVASGGSFDYRRAHSTSIGSIVAAFGVLRDLHEARNAWSVPRAVEEVLARTRARLTFLLTPQGEQRVANLNKVVTLARALEESGILTFRAFVHWLRDMEEQAVDEAESPTVEEGDNVVRVMSIHAAKGLEFPIVVIPDLGRGPGGGADHLLLQRVTGRSAVYMGRVGKWPIQTRNYEDLKEEHEKREAAERLRVLYVAMTRAKDALVLPVFPKPGSSSLMEDILHVLPEQPLFGRTLREWHLVGAAEIPRVSQDPPPVRLSLAESSTRAGDTVAVERDVWQGVRRAALAEAVTPDLVRHPSEMVDLQASEALKHAGTRLETEPGGRGLGTLVHDVLAVIPYDRPELIDAFVRFFARQRNLGARLSQRASVLVRSALEDKSVRDAVARRSWREVPFAAQGPEGLAEGAIDLLVEMEGVVLTDFKTDTISGDGNRLGLLNALYAPQIEQYAELLKLLGIEAVARRLLFLDAKRVQRT
jgi:ATP-dependent helicase/nuclease subunit A